MSDRLGTGKANWAGSLESLMAVPGVLAGLIATEEGLPLDARLRTELDREAFAAAAAVLGQLGGKMLKGGATDGLKLVVMDSSKYRFMVQPVALGYLMVVMEPQVAADPVAIQMAETVAMLDYAAPATSEPRVV